MTDETSTQNAVTIDRTFEAPVDLVWRMWTEPEHFTAWYGPAGTSIRVAKMDLRVGGTRMVCMEMTTPGGTVQMWFTGEYREISEHTRLVYTESMSDASGKVLSSAEAGLPAGHPTTTEVTVELEDLDGRTRMTLTHVGIPEGSPGAEGWGMAIDKLAAHLAGQSRS
jgi:uncharacterized protein YndB with AHSA1/START domain